MQTWNVELALPWPPWLTLLLVACAAAFVAAVYRREARGFSPYAAALAALRLIAFAILLLMLGQATLVRTRTEPPAAAVLIDDSASMTAVDDYSDPERKAISARLRPAGVDPSDLSRWNLARALLLENDASLLRGIAKHHKLHIFFLDNAQPGRQCNLADLPAELHTAAPRGEYSRLGAGVRELLDDLRGAAPAAMILLTDGVNTDGPTLADGAGEARRRGVPLFFIGLGSPKPPRTLELSNLLADDAAFLGDVLTFDCTLSANGLQNQPITVVLREKDKPAVLAQSTATIAAGGRPQPIQLHWRPAQAGQYDFVLEARSSQEKPPPASNQLAHSVQVRKEKIRILLVANAPTFEFRYLANMLRRDPTIELHTLLQQADPNHAEQDASALRAFPASRDELFAYDAVIFGDVDPALLSPASLRNLADFVDQPAQGGELVLIAGPNFMPAAYAQTPLARLLPFAAGGERLPDPKTLREGFVVQPTDAGLANPAMQLSDVPSENHRIWQSLAPLYWLLELPELKPGVRVLAEHPTLPAADGRRLPVICLQYVGAGKVLFHATDETWRWRYRTGDAYFARYWLQTIRSLCRAKLAEAERPVALATDRRHYDPNEPVQIQLRFVDERLAPPEDDGAAVVVEHSGGKSHRVVLRRTSTRRGLFEASFLPSIPGDYRVRLVAPTLKDAPAAIDFTVTRPAAEFARLPMDASAMRRAVELTGGGFFTFAEADRLPAAIPPGRPVPVESLPPVPLWNRWPVLTLLLSVLCAEWILRKRRGMV